MPNVRHVIHITFARKTGAIRETSQPNRGFERDTATQRNELVRIRRLATKRSLLYRQPAGGRNRGTRPAGPGVGGSDAY